jgi:CRISPR associated protein, Cas1 family
MNRNQDVRLLTGGPRLSVNPANSLLNYTNAVAESECRLAACACGLDPGLGVLHTDTANRDSLALDLIETIRPAIEAWILNWLTHEPLRRSHFIMRLARQKTTVQPLAHRRAAPGAYSLPWCSHPLKGLTPLCTVTDLPIFASIPVDPHSRS